MARTEKVGHILTVHLKEKADSVVVKSDDGIMIARELDEKMAEPGIKQLRVMADGIEHITSALLGKLVSIRKKEGIESVQLINPTPHIREVVKTTRLDIFIEMVDTTGTSEESTPEETES